MGTPPFPQVAEAAAATAADRSEARTALCSGQDAEAAELQRNERGLSEAVLAKQASALQRRQEKELADFDRKTDTKLDAARQSAGLECDVAAAERKMELQARQLAEMAEVMGAHLPGPDSAKYRALQKEFEKDKGLFQDDTLSALRKEVERAKEEQEVKRKEKEKEMR